MGVYSKSFESDLVNILSVVSLALNQNEPTIICNQLVDSGMVALDTQSNKYKITEGGEMYVKALADVPFPVMVWQMPKQDDE